ncbi:MAG TPA: hypothetical protein DIS93_07900 [Bdellovibrionales bacterium]|nr:hypothetical protein [Bdellovibrionales bacterium]
MRHKVGAYIRVSTEEQAQVLEGSLDSQRHRLASFVELKNLQEPHWGNIVDVYADEGFSAKDTRRPALQRLLGDLRSGKVNLILVTDLSRLSRNILDFCLLLEDLKKYNAKFLSVKEQFDTTTAAGEMMVFNMINLAQFERKQTAERVSQNFHSRALRGLLNGGPVILGYDKDPNMPAQYVANKEEAPLVRDVFRIFLEEGSLSRASRRLNKSKIPRKLGTERSFRLASIGVWTPDSLRNLLENKAYIGIREVNKKYRGKDPFSLRPWQMHKESKAAWPGIVPEQIFENVQRVLKASKAIERPKKNHESGSPFILTGLLKCGECGAPFIGETGHGRISTHRYYGHKQYQGIPFKCSIRRFPVETIEEEIEKHLTDIALNPKGLESVGNAIAENIDIELSDVRKEKERVQTRLAVIDQDVQRVFRMLGEMTDGPGLKLVKDQIEALGTEKTALTARKQEVEARIERSSSLKEALDGLKERIAEFKAGWRKGTLAQKKRLLRAIFDRLEVMPGSLGVYYLVPSEQVSEGPGGSGAWPSATLSKEIAGIQTVKTPKAAGNFVSPTALGSSITKFGVTNGA